MSNENRIIFSSTRNSRFVGAAKYIIRSDFILTFNDNDIEFLISKNIKNIIDLRSDKEILKRPCVYPNGFKYHHLPLHESGILPYSGDEVGRFYFSIAAAEKPVYLVLKAIAESSEGTVFFCRSGKDRTGIISALLLGLADYPDDYISADYELTGIYLKDIIYSWLPQNPEYEKDAVTPLPKHILSFLRLLREEYGSVCNYCKKIGLTSGNIKKLKNIV